MHSRREFIHTQTHRERVYWSDLQAVVWLVYQWLSLKGRAKNPIVFYFIQLDVSAGLQPTLES